MNVITSAANAFFHPVNRIPARHWLGLTAAVAAFWCE
jgi:hypothetical protein